MACFWFCHGSAASTPSAADEELDRRCERLLRKQFGLRIDFTAEHAIPALLAWGLVQRQPLLQQRPRQLRQQQLPLPSSASGLPAAAQGQPLQEMGTEEGAAVGLPAVDLLPASQAEALGGSPAAASWSTLRQRGLQGQRLGEWAPLCCLWVRIG